MPGSKKAESLFKTLFGRVLKRQDVLAADLMALDLRYNSPQTGTSLGATALFNGNISQMMWASTGSAPEQAGYGFTYDGLNRLRSANYAEGTSYTSGAGKFSTSYSYDANGNMATLSRYMDGTQVDNLGYTYLSGGNRLGSVSDGTANPLGYKAVTGSYLYDNNGNMVKDISKGFTIAYNSLNLPQLVSSVNDYARYTYDAAGTRLAKTITNGSASTVRTDYSGPFMYENSVLKCIFTPEGRIVPLNSNGAMSYSYEYNLKDHLGNTRVTFTGHGYGRPEVNLLTSYDPYGLVTSQTSFYPTGASKNKLLYNGKEFQDDVLAGSKIDWFDYGARMYDPAIGRWSVIDNKAEKYFSLTPYCYAGDNPIRYIDPDGNKLVDANGHIMYTQKGGWTKYATADARRLGTAMMGSRTGTKQWNTMASATHPITITISPEDKTTTNADGTKTFLLGNTLNKSSIDAKTGKVTVTKSDITIYEGSINNFMNSTVNSKSDNAKSYQNNTTNNDERIGAVGTHESVHATDQNNIQQSVDNKKNNETNDVEAVPTQVEMKALDETGLKNMRMIEPRKLDKLF